MIEVEVNRAFRPKLTKCRELTKKKDGRAVGFTKDGEGRHGLGRSSGETSSGDGAVEAPK